jgi:hypothetical protein
VVSQVSAAYAPSRCPIDVLRGPSGSGAALTINYKITIFIKAIAFTKEVGEDIWREVLAIISSIESTSRFWQ